jgi:DNA-binding response OmpR family regulator
MTKNLSWTVSASFLKTRVLQFKQLQVLKKLITSTRPHVCITDMGLDGINGDEFILKAHAASPKTLFMMHTGASFDLTDELRAIGMTTEDILIKPVIDFTLFSNRIRAHAAGGANDNAS